MQSLVFIIFLSFLSASISRLLEYALGLSDPDAPGTKEIFFPYTHFLSLRRLNKEKDFNFLEQLNDSTPVSPGFKQSCEDPMNKSVMEASRKKAVVDRAQSYFTWEKAVGMCVYCTGVWVAIILSIAVGLIFNLALIQIIFLLLCIPALSHFILRKI